MTILVKEAFSESYLKTSSITIHKFNLLGIANSCMILGSFFQISVSLQIEPNYTEVFEVILILHIHIPSLDRLRL